jgi:NNP family nitrate/nitrite transporter-like MFS transporter
MALITAWQPEDRAFWEREGERVARRNLALSIPALVLAFAVWSVWSAVVVYLPHAGFAFSTTQLFWLAGLPALSGAALRLAYAFVVPVVGGRQWAAFSTASLLVPTLGLGLAVQDPGTGYATFVALALLSGLGGGNFASSMSHLSFFFPAAQKGLALELNAGLGNLGVSLVQFAVPLAVAAGVFGALGGPPQPGAAPGTGLWLQNAGFLWVPFIVLAAFATWRGMDDLAQARASFAEQAAVLHRRHTWTLCWLYLGTFGSYIGFAASLPLLLELQFPGSHALNFAWIGPLLGALARPVGGWMADQLGSARVIFASFLAMLAAVAGALACLPWDGQPAGSLAGFVTFSFALFFACGTGNGAVFRLAPAAHGAERERRAARSRRPDDSEGMRLATAEGAAALGVASAVGAVGGFFIPIACGVSFAATGSAAAALSVFVLFYATCAALTWRAATRHDEAVPD